MKEIAKAHNAALYKEESLSGTTLTTLLFSSPETQRICNDPFLLGVSYTSALCKAMETLLLLLQSSAFDYQTRESSTLVFHILRGGLNFGLREALYHAYGWDHHRSAFISSQRAYDKDHGWYITENRYEKIPQLPQVDIILADVVATGVSLEYALNKIIDILNQQKSVLRRVTFVTIGGKRAYEICKKIDEYCRSLWAEYEGTVLVFVEGVFAVAEEQSPLSIFLQGTDLLRRDSVLTPEFIASQSEELAYALERCTIYDAGSRAFDTGEYLEDVYEYWEKVLTLAKNGMTYTDYLAERFPEDSRLQNEEWKNTHHSAELLQQIATEQLLKK